MLPGCAGPVSFNAQGQATSNSLPADYDPADLSSFNYIMALYGTVGPNLFPWA